MKNPTKDIANSSGKKRRLERLAMLFATAAIGALAWYWQAQVRSVLEILEMAYG